MRTGWAVLLAMGLAAASASGAPAQTSEMVRFTGADGTSVQAVLMRPSGTGPFPAVVALHGCGGRDNARGELARRQADWASRWTGQGLAVLMPDSFASRGLGSQCGVRGRTVRPARERLADVAGARVYLQARSDIRQDRISLVGWSNGGSTALYAASRTARPADGRPDFVQAIAFYPGCRTPLERGLVNRLPLTILIGGADDWTPAAPCEALVSRARSMGAPAEIVVYPGAFHGFDDPASRLRERTGLAFTPDGSGRARVGTDPAARADAIRRVDSLIAAR